MLLGDRALVADVVLELGPRVLQDGADLHRGLAPGHRSAGALAGGVELHEQVPARVAEPALGGGLLTHVAVVEQDELGAEQLGHGLHVGQDIRHDAHADLVGDLGLGVAVDEPASDTTRGLGGIGLDGLGPPGHGEVVDAGVVEQLGHQRDVLVRRRLDLGEVLRVPRDDPAESLRLLACHGTSLHHAGPAAPGCPGGAGHQSCSRVPWAAVRAAGSRRSSRSGRPCSTSAAGCAPRRRR